MPLILLQYRIVQTCSPTFETVPFTSGTQRIRAMHGNVLIAAPCSLAQLWDTAIGVCA
jgi:hypothetical protein